MKTLFVFILIFSLNLSLCEECTELVNNLTQKFQEKIKETEDRLMLKLQEEIARNDEQLIQLVSKLEDIIRDDFTKYLEENKEMVPLYEIQDAQEFSRTLHYIKNKELIDASANGRIEAVKRLVAEGADTNWKNWNGKSSIILAASSGHQEVVKILLAHGADINSTNSLILGKKDLEMVKLLLDNGADVNYIYMKGTLSLILGMKDLEIAKLLLDNVANVNYIYMKGGYSNLMWSVIFNRKEKIQVLLDYGADVNIRDDKGNTSLMLITVGADVIRARTKQGDTSLRNTRAEIAEILISSGADVNAKNKDGRTALDHVEWHTEIKEVLKQHGAKHGRDID